MANTRDSLNACQYIDDAGKPWRVDITDAVMSAGTFSPAPAGTSYLPKHAKMRHIGAKDGTASKKRHQIPVASGDNSKYRAGGTVVLDGVTLTITGRTGEKFRL